MNEKHNGRGIFYGVIGVATLVVAIIGATFAYFTATANANSVINGNFATISFSLNVTKVTTAGDTSGLIPMTNGQVDTAVSAANTTANGICMDDNGNAVCQIYKIVVTNTSTATMMVDGYVSISGGPEVATYAPTDYSSATTNMRWAQVFCSGDDNALTGCTTNGTVDLGVNGGSADIAALATTTDTLHNADKILTTKTAISGTATIDGNSYDTVGTNFIRISNRAEGATSYTREADPTSALVWSQQLAPNGNADSKNISTYYLVVWLAESGAAQNTAGTAPTAFVGSVTFNSAEGSEVTATFSSAAKVTPTTTTTTQTPAESGGE